MHLGGTVDRLGGRGPLASHHFTSEKYPYAPPATWDGNVGNRSILPYGTSAPAALISFRDYDNKLALLWTTAGKCI